MVGVHSIDLTDRLQTLGTCGKVRLVQIADVTAFIK